MKESWIQFTAHVNDNSVGRFINVVTQLQNSGMEKLNVMLSTPGGYVRSGVTAYNFLRSLPSEVITWNTGQVHSIGGTFFVAGEKRYSAPNSNFLIHSVSLTVEKPQSFEEKVLRERLSGIEEDTRNIASILSERMNISLETINNMMLTGVTLGTEEAKKNGLIHDILSPKIPKGSPIFSITDVA